MLDFYPRFGFRRVTVRQPVIELPAAASHAPRSYAPRGNVGWTLRVQSSVRRKGSSPTVLTRHGASIMRFPREAREPVDAYLRSRAVFSSRLDCTNAAPLNWFHLLNDPSLCLYEVLPLQAMLIIQHQGHNLHLVDVVARRPFSFDDLAPYLDFPGIDTVRFGFNPDWLGVDCAWQAPSEEPNLFVRGDWDLPDPFILPYLLTT